MQPLRYAAHWVSIAVLLAVAVAAFGAPAGNVNDTRLRDDTSGENWLVKGGSFRQQQFSPLRQITRENVGKLGLAWVTELNEPMGLAAEPLVIDGVIYLSAPRSVVYAIDAASGRIIWTFDPHVRLDQSLDNSLNARTNRGVAVWAGKVFVGTGDGRIVAIDAATGTLRWASPVCDPRQSGITGAPRVARGKVFIGYSGADEQVRGSLAAFDAESGKELWRFWTVPGNPADGFESKALEMAAKTWSGADFWTQGGGTVWEPITFDAATGLLLFGTSKSFRGEGTAGQESAGGAKLFSGSIVAVHADSGEYAWHYQTSTPRRQTENFHIALADLAIGGRMRHIAMTAARNGTFYVLDAATGELISQKPLVPQEKLIPSGRRDVEQMDYPGVVVRGVEDCPGGGCFGVRNWWPMSYNPVTQLVYVPIMDRRRDGTTPGALPMVGRLIAWDPKLQETRWSVEHPIIVNSGVLSTAGKLVFQGEGTGEFAAYDAQSGRKLWSILTGSAINAVPVTFSLHAEQYVIVPVGWGSIFRLFAPASMMVTPQSKYGPSRLLAFRLGASGALPQPTSAAAEVPRPPTQTYSRDAVKRGAELVDTRNCTSCHSPRLDGSGRWSMNGAVPDLRYMPPEAHRDWNAIVLGGSHRDQGMLAFGVAMSVPATPALSVSDADDIHAYVIDRAWAAYEQQQRERKKKP